LPVDTEVERQGPSSKKPKTSGISMAATTM
jgi:hypothetical protein